MNYEAHVIDINIVMRKVEYLKTMCEHAIISSDEASDCLLKYLNPVRKKVGLKAFKREDVVGMFINTHWYNWQTSVDK